MATKYWLGRVVAVAQVADGSVDTYDASSTYKLTIGSGNNKVEFTTSGDGTIGDTAAALIAAHNASTHPYASVITASNSAGDITLTADTAGVPFTASLTVSGGTGTVTDFSDTTANASPNDFGDANNFSDLALPGNNDTVIFRDNAINVCWGLEDVTATGLTLLIEQSFTGKIGLRSSAFATSSDGDTIDATQPEYRAHYLQLDVLELQIGQNPGGGSPIGSQRIKIDNDKAGASTTTVHQTASSSADTGFPAVRLLLAHASADVFVRAASGGMGIAVDEPGETSTCGDVVCSAETTATEVRIGSGTTITSFEQRSGRNRIEPAAAITTVNCRGGILNIEGDQAVTTLNADGGTVYCNTTGTVTTINLAGTVDTLQSDEARTLTTVNLERNGTLRSNSAVTVTNLNEPSDPYVLTVAAAA